MSEVKSCPFCGSIAVVWKTKHKEYPYKVECSACNCKTTRWRDPENAIDAWNKRADMRGDKK